MTRIEQPQSRADRNLHMTVWAAQVVILLGFGVGATMKILLPIPTLAGIWSWAGDLPPLAVRTLGVIDLLGGLGVVLPTVTGIVPRLTILAALGCVALQLCAMTFHILRGEIEDVPVNVVLLALAAFIALGRGLSQIRIPADRSATTLAGVTK